MPADYFAINAPVEVYQKLGMTPVHLPGLSAAVKESLAGRTGGGVSLAVGMAYIFSRVPFMEGLMSYWYHFAIMFEALFILAAVDTGTRVGRFLLQEIFGKFAPKFKQEKWMPGIIITSALFTLAWGRLLYTGNIATIWPIFGISNQLLAACGLIVGTTLIIRMNKARFAWITAVPGIFMAFITILAGYKIIVNSYIPKRQYLLLALSVVVILLMASVFFRAFKRWAQLLKVKKTTVDKFGESVLEEVEE
jgi:carbon starvation protein